MEVSQDRQLSEQAWQSFNVELKKVPAEQVLEQMWLVYEYLYPVMHDKHWVSSKHVRQGY